MCYTIPNKQTQGNLKMIIYKECGFSFQFRSGGVVVLKGREYIGFYDNIELAFKHVFG